MEDTGIPLFAHRIPTPAHKSSILQCTGRREGQKAGGAIGADKTAAHRFGLSRIIESPSTKEKKNEHNGLFVQKMLWCLSYPQAIERNYFQKSFS